MMCSRRVAQGKPASPAGAWLWAPQRRAAPRCNSWPPLPARWVRAASRSRIGSRILDAVDRERDRRRRDGAGRRPRLFAHGTCHRDRVRRRLRRPRRVRHGRGARRVADAARAVRHDSRRRLVREGTRPSRIDAGPAAPGRAPDDGQLVPPCRRAHRRAPKRLGSVAGPTWAEDTLDYARQLANRTDLRVTWITTPPIAFATKIPR